MPPTPVIKWEEVASSLGYPTVFDMIDDLYWNQSLTLKEAGFKIGCSDNALRRKMIELGIRARTQKENMKLGKINFNRHTFKRRKK